MTMKIGEKLRTLREKKQKLLREVAASLEIDTAYLSKMERGEKKIKREYLVKLAKLYDVDLEELIPMWLADKVYDILKDEEFAEKALKLADQEVRYQRKNND